MTPKTLKAIADRWTAHTTHATDVFDLVREIVRQAEQIRRLRESLVAVIAESDRASVAYDKAKAILKETAP